MGGDLPQGGGARLQVVIGAEPPARLDKALTRDVPEEAALSRSKLMKLIEEGAVSRNGIALTDPRQKVAEGDILEIVIGPPAPMFALPEAIPLEILYEDAELLVVNKPAGMVVHPAPGSPSGTLVNALLHHCGTDLSRPEGVADWRPGIVHRIDKDTSGLLVVAKSDRAHQGLAAQFADHSIERRYLALCQGQPSGADPRLAGLRGVSNEPGGVLRIATGLDRHRFDRQKQAVKWEGGRHAVTRARVLEGFGSPVQAALAEFQLETGRTHQIRVHAAYIGHPLVGDQTYGGARKPSEAALPKGAAEALKAFPRQALHAATLGFLHPVSGEELAFTAPLPGDFEALLTQLRG